VWVNDAGGVLVVNERTGASYWLTGTEAALWRWLHQGYSGAEVLHLYSALLNLSTPQGGAQLQSTLRSWVEMGLLEAAGG
jgi:hypothetical protein